MRSFTSPSIHRLRDYSVLFGFGSLVWIVCPCSVAVLFLGTKSWGKWSSCLIWRVAFTGNCAAADTASIPLFSRPNISGPCWSTSWPWTSEKPPGGITKLLRNGGTLKWKEHAVFFKKRANQNPYAFVFRQQIEKIWLHGIKNTWIEWFTCKFMLDSEIKHEH